MTTHTDHDHELQHAIDTLNGLLHGERSAVETYELAIAQFRGEAPKELQDCLRSHLMRVDRLTQRIGELGGSPILTSGTWGTFAKLVENGAAAFGRKAAIAALEEGEDIGLRQYDDALDDLDADSLHLVEGELLFEERSTHAAMGVLKSRYQDKRSPGGEKES